MGAGGSKIMIQEEQNRLDHLKPRSPLKKLSSGDVLRSPSKQQRNSLAKGYTDGALRLPLVDDEESHEQARIMSATNQPKSIDIHDVYPGRKEPHRKASKVAEDIPITIKLPSRRGSWNSSRECESIHEAPPLYPDKNGRRLSWDGSSAVPIASAQALPGIGHSNLPRIISNNKLFETSESVAAISISPPRDVLPSSSESDDDVSYSLLHNSAMFNSSHFLQQKKLIDAHNAQLEEEVERLQMQLLMLDRQEKERRSQKGSTSSNTATQKGILVKQRQEASHPALQFEYLARDNPAKSPGSRESNSLAVVHPDPPRGTPPDDPTALHRKRRAVRSPIQVRPEANETLLMPSPRGHKTETKEETAMLLSPRMQLRGDVFAPEHKVLRSPRSSKEEALPLASPRRSASSLNTTADSKQPSVADAGYKPQSPRVPNTNGSLASIKRKMHLKSRSEVMTDPAVEVPTTVAATKPPRGSKSKSTREAEHKASTENAQGQVWTRALSQSWSEVEFLLRRPIHTKDDLVYAKAAAEAGLLFIDQVTALAESLGVLRGTISRWILPFDNNTSLQGGQCSTPGSVTTNIPLELRGRITERQVHYLVNGANNVRQLVRIKIADDNDLLQARAALNASLKFFRLLDSSAKSAAITPFELLTIGINEFK